MVEGKAHCACIKILKLKPQFGKTCICVLQMYVSVKAILPMVNTENMETRRLSSGKIALLCHRLMIVQAI